MTASDFQTLVHAKWTKGEGLDAFLMRFKQLEGEAGNSVNSTTVMETLRGIIYTSPNSKDDDISYKLANADCRTLAEVYREPDRICTIRAGFSQNTDTPTATNQTGSWCRNCRTNTHNTERCRNPNSKGSGDRRSRSREPRGREARNRPRDRSDSRTMYPRNNTRYDKRDDSRDRPRNRSNSRGSEGGRKSPGKSSDCYDCGKPGHIARDCPTRKPGNRTPERRRRDDTPDRPRRNDDRGDNNCSYCKRVGHTVEKCYKKANDERKNDKGHGESRSPRDRSRM